ESFAASLFTAVPSRSFFPRGFLWDEGFHQLLVSAWDPAISVDVLGHWLGLLHVHGSNGSAGAAGVTCPGGWIPREQILGEVARRRVPVEFMAQDISVANPPTLLLLAERLLDSLGSDNATSVTNLTSLAGFAAAARGDSGSGGSENSMAPLVLQFLSSAAPALDRWIQWLLHTQRPEGQPPPLGAFQWRGRDPAEAKLNPITLASGLDDFPRASHPSPEEHHVDLLCWMAMACRVMGRLQATIRPPGVEGAAEGTAAWLDVPYEAIAKELTVVYERVHWDRGSQAYFDRGLHSAGGEIVEEVVVRCSADGGGGGGGGRTVDVGASQADLQTGMFRCPPDFPRLLYPLGDGRGGLLTRERLVGGGRPKLQAVKHFGYVSLFPLLLRLLPARSKRLRHVLDSLTDPNLLWSPHGLRSLSADDLFYQRSNAPGDEPYWRGHIWINVNFLALRALRHYADAVGPHRAVAADAYARLRENVLRTVLGEFHRTGFFWEQYDDRTGEGRRSRPFTGWTALVVNIMAEIY
ncbi:unnamed protein product, partial [Phaeothamnion confervicola]